MSANLGKIRTNEKRTLHGSSEVQSIGSSAEVRVIAGSLTIAETIGSSAMVSAGDSITVAGTIGSSATVKASGILSAKAIGSSATVSAEDSITIDETIGPNARVTTRGSLSAKTIGSSATVNASDSITVDETIGSSAEITVLNGNLTVKDIGSSATVTLKQPHLLTAETIAIAVRITLEQGGQLRIGNAIPEIRAEMNSGNVVIAGGNNRVIRNGLPISPTSMENISKIIDAAARLNIEIHQNIATNQVQVFVNGHKLPEEFTQSLSIYWENKELFLNRKKIEATPQELRIDGQLVPKNSLVQTTSHNSASSFSSHASPAFLPPPKTNEKEPLVANYADKKNNGNEERNCCCAVM